MPDRCQHSPAADSKHNLLKICLLIFWCLGLCKLEISAQDRLSDVDMVKVPQRKVRNFIRSQITHRVDYFSDILPTQISEQEKLQYKDEDEVFTIRENISKVWHAYTSASPAVAWNGRMVSFGLLVSKAKHTITYRNSRQTALDTGQVVYLNIRIMGGIYNLAVAFEITTIDSINRLIEFRYVKGDRSQGIQQISFVKTSDGFTKIIHRTLFKSNSSLRDRWLYPAFHRKTVMEYHRNILHYMLVPV